MAKADMPHGWETMAHNMLSWGGARLVPSDHDFLLLLSGRCAAAASCMIPLWAPAACWWQQPPWARRRWARTSTCVSCATASAAATVRRAAAPQPEVLSAWRRFARHMAYALAGGTNILREQHMLTAIFANQAAANLVFYSMKLQHRASLMRTKHVSSSAGAGQLGQLQEI